MYSANLPTGYRGSPGQAYQCLIEPPTHRRYTIQQDYPSGYNGQSCGQAGGPNEGHRPVRREFQEYRGESHAPLGNKGPFSPLAEGCTIGALTVSSLRYCNPPDAVLESASHHVLALQFSNSEGASAPAQLRQPPYEGQPADRAVPNNVQDMYDFSSPLSSPGRNPGLKSLQIPNRQYLTASTSSSPPIQDARQSPIIRNSTSPSERCPCPYPRCDQKFTGSSRKGNMSRHIRTKHGAPGSVAREYLCSSRVCGKKFKRNDAKLNHERREHPELGRLSAVPRKTSNQTATRNLAMSTPQK